MRRKMQRRSLPSLLSCWLQGLAANKKLVATAQHTHAWIVWLVVLVFTLMQFISQLTTGVMADSFTNTFHLNSLSLGLLIASYYFIYVPMQGPAGMLLDRYGPRILLSCGALIFSLGCFVLGHALNLPMAILGRMVMGLGASFAFIGCINTATRWFPRSFIVGLTSGLELTGIAAVLIGDRYLPLGLMVFGWRAVMLLGSAIAAAVGVAIWLLVRNASPYERVKLKQPCHSHNVMRRMGWRKCLFSISRRKSMWINGIYCGVMFSYVSVFSALWGIPYLQHVKGLSLALASQVDNYLLLGVLIGCLLMILFQKKIKDELKVMRVAAILMGLVGLTVIFYPYMPIWLIEFTLVLIGVISPVYLLCFKICSQLLPDSLRASSTGFTNMMMMAIAPVFQLVFAGVVMISAHWVAHFHGEQIAMLLFPILIFTAGFLVKKIKIPKNRPLR